MKILTVLCLCFSIILVNAQVKIQPLLKSSGAVFEVPYASEKLDSKLEYKIIASVGDEIEKPAELHPSLAHLARMYNLHIYGGVPQKNMNVVLIAYGRATPIVLSNEAYRLKYNVDNPNLTLIEELNKAGVKVMVCSQSLEVLGLDHKTVSPVVTPAISRFTTLSTYQLKGYALFAF